MFIIMIFIVCAIVANFLIVKARNFFMAMIGADGMFFNVRNHIVLVVLSTMVMASFICGKLNLLDDQNKDLNSYTSNYESKNQQESLSSLNNFQESDYEYQEKIDDSNNLDRLNSFNIDNEKLQFGYADASSVFYEEGFDYNPYNLIDGDLNTLWVEGVDGNGEGESILISDRIESYSVRKIKIYNGFPDEKLYYMNSRVKGIMIEFDDGTIIYEVLEDSRAPQTIVLDEPVSTSGIKFTIVSTYPGSKFQDTCLTEIEIY